jgi:hypothetical protein
MFTRNYGVVTRFLSSITYRKVKIIISPKNGKLNSGPINGRLSTTFWAWLPAETKMVL